MAEKKDSSKKAPQKSNRSKGEAPRRSSIQSRHSFNRQVRQEGLREELKAKEYIRQIGLDYTELGKLIKRVKVLKANKLTKETAKILGRLHSYSLCKFELEKCMAEKEILRNRLDVNFRRLKFCLPELKSIELTDPGGNNPFSQLLEMMINATKDTSL